MEIEWKIEQERELEREGKESGRGVLFGKSI
jgi:hypothetical protein